LIKNGENKYVAAIYGMNNFHWYTLYEGRGKSYLSKALKNNVISFLLGSFHQRIEEPFEISIGKGIVPKNFKASLNLAKSVGFKVDVENDYMVKLILIFDDFNGRDLTIPVIPNLKPETKKHSLQKLKWQKI